MLESALKILVLAGGPDRERDVSLLSGKAVADALRDAGHEVLEHDIHPHDTSALDTFEQWPGDVIFPVLHGKWGEGGGLQHILDARELPYVGCGGPVAELCMDKHRTKLVLERHNIPTPPCELLAVGQPSRLKPPVVVKPTDEGSSIALSICHTPQQVAAARHQMRNAYAKVLIEKYIPGRELTVGIISRAPDEPHGDRALPTIEIIPAADYYDYQAKYESEQTQYRFDIDLPAEVLKRVQQLALQAHRVLGVRHLSRVDFIVDENNQPWVLEVNTMPGFTTHSLLPMAAAHAGLPMADLVDRLVHLPVSR